MKFFKPEDFDGITHEWENRKFIRVEYAVDICNAKLEREGRVVYLTQTNQPTNNMLEKQYDWHTHKALLINIEPLEKCRHPKEKVTKRINWEGIYECECGQRLKPASFEEV